MKMFCQWYPSVLHGKSQKYYQNQLKFSFAMLATIIGFFSIGKQSKCGFTLYAVMSAICIIGKETLHLTREL